MNRSRSTRLRPQLGRVVDQVGSPAVHAASVSVAHRRSAGAMATAARAAVSRSFVTVCKLEFLIAEELVEVMAVEYIAPLSRLPVEVGCLRPLLHNIKAPQRAVRSQLNLDIVGVVRLAMRVEGHLVQVEAVGGGHLADSLPLRLIPN